MTFFLEVLIGGLLSGVMYSLVALGFVLIYKASGVFNFAQGAMVFFAAVTFVGLQEYGLGFWTAFGVTLLVMMAGAVLTEKFVLRPLVNQPQITLFMATIGLTFFLEGLTQMVWGSNRAGARARHRTTSRSSGSPTRPASTCRSSTSSPRASRASLVALLALLFQKTQGRPRAARGRRRSPGGAVDRHSAAADLGDRLGGRRLRRASSSGLIWGARNGVQFALTFVALKALPVLILGGFDSIPGAIVGGLIIGAAEKLAEVYLGPIVGGGIEGWVAVRARAALPAGPARGAVRREAHRSRLSRVRLDFLSNEPFPLRCPTPTSRV